MSATADKFLWTKFRALGYNRGMSNVVAGQQVTIKGEEWRVVGVGLALDDRVYLHLAHTSRGVQQKNGFRPIQQALWVAYTDIEQKEIG